MARHSKAAVPQGTNRIALSERGSPSSTAVGHEFRGDHEENKFYKEQVGYD